MPTHILPLLHAIGSVNNQAAGDMRTMHYVMRGNNFVCPSDALSHEATLCWVAIVGHSALAIPKFDAAVALLDATTG